MLCGQIYEAMTYLVVEVLFMLWDVKLAFTIPRCSWFRSGNDAIYRCYFDNDNESMVFSV